MYVDVCASIEENRTVCHVHTRTLHLYIYYSSPPPTPPPPSISTSPPHLPPSPLPPPLLSPSYQAYVSVVFLVAYIVESAMRTIAYGLIFHPKAYLRSAYNLLDLLTILFG